MLDIGVPVEQVIYRSGHKPVAMTNRYDNANEERYGTVVRAVPLLWFRSGVLVLAAGTWQIQKQHIVTEVYGPMTIKVQHGRP